MFDLSFFNKNKPESELEIELSANDVYLNPRNDFYVIGDLYHVFRKLNPSFWERLCTETNNFENHIWSDCYNDIFIYNFPTINGEGLYQDTIGNAFLIESGTIGCMSSFSFWRLTKDFSYLTDKLNSQIKSYSPFLYISEYDFLTQHFPIEYNPNWKNYTHRFGKHFLNMGKF